jgi:hypothetical protein
VALRAIRIGCTLAFVAGIGGMIAASIAGNNVGLVTTIGLVTAVAAIVLVTASTVGATRRIDAFDDARAERVEALVAGLVARGTDESTVRRLVREAVELGRSAARNG